MTAEFEDDPSLVPVDLVGLPVELHRRSSDHHATVMRELALIVASEELDTVPARVLALSEELTSKYAGFTTGPQAALEGALHRGETSIDLHFDIPRTVADAAARFDDLLDEVDRYCQAGELLTLVSAPDVLAYRKWFLGEFVRQLRHRLPPTPWSGDASRLDPVEPTSAAAERRRELRVEEDLDLEGAAQLRTQISSFVDDGVTDLVLDLSACEFLDSVGISLLLTSRARLTDRGGSLVITNPTAQVASALEHAGILDLLLGI